MTAEEFINERFIPKEAEKRGKRYKDYRRKYQNIIVSDETDTRPIKNNLGIYSETVRYLNFQTRNSARKNNNTRENYG